MTFCVYLSLPLCPRLCFFCFFFNGIVKFLDLNDDRFNLSLLFFSEIPLQPASDPSCKVYDSLPALLTEHTHDT